jgi:hypothetical protein
VGITIIPPGAESEEVYPVVPYRTYNATTGPGASVSLANFSGGSTLPAPAFYDVVAQFYFGPGTAPVDGTDNDNVSFRVDGVSNGRLLVPIVQNSVLTVTFRQVYTALGTIALQTINAGTAAVIYRSALTAVRVG